MQKRLGEFFVPKTLLIAAIFIIVVQESSVEIVARVKIVPGQNDRPTFAPVVLCRRYRDIFSRCLLGVGAYVGLLA